jgi:hypothetical protein
MKNQLTSQMHDDNLRSFLMQKESWSTQIFDAIDWNFSERALRRLSKNRQMNVVKLCHNYWHIGSRHVSFLWRRTPMLFLSRNQRGLETYPKLSVTGCELPSRRLMVKSKEGHANVETPGRLLDSY